MGSGYIFGLSLIALAVVLGAALLAFWFRLRDIERAVSRIRHPNPEKTAVPYGLGVIRARIDELELRTEFLPDADERAAQGEVPRRLSLISDGESPTIKERPIAASPPIGTVPHHLRGVFLMASYWADASREEVLRMVMSLDHSLMHPTEGERAARTELGCPKPDRERPMRSVREMAACAREHGDTLLESGMITSLEALNVAGLIEANWSAEMKSLTPVVYDQDQEEE